MGRRGLFLLLLSVLGNTQAVRHGPMPPPARAHCRVFVVAAMTHTRVLILQNAYEQDGVNVYDQFPVLSSILMDTSTSSQDEKTKVDEAHQILRPAFELAVEWLKNRVDPALCFAHFVVAETELDFDVISQDKATSTASRVIERLDQLRSHAKNDRYFPFALNEPSLKYSDDEGIVISSGDLRVVPAPWRRFFHVVGANYYAGKVAPSLSPGQVEVFGLLHVDAGGQAGKSNSESDSNAAEMVFDVKERWRRSRRQRQVNVALNMSDFYGQEYPGFGRHAVQQAVIQLKRNQDREDAPKGLQHPCFFKHSFPIIEGVNVTLEGTGDAYKCLELLRSHVISSTKDCPTKKFCVMGSTPQPRCVGSFYASGVLREAVLETHRVLEYLSNKENGEDVDLLILPNPTLLSLQNAANLICRQPYEDIVLSNENEVDSALHASVFEGNSTILNTLCFDLCYTIVLLEQIDVQDDDERIYFVDHFEKEPILFRHGSSALNEHGNPSELVTWLTGAFLYLEALQRKVTFSIESELLAEQLSAGLPLGWNMSLVVFVAACIYLYLTTGRSMLKTRSHRGSGAYNRVVNGSPKAKYKDTTQSILFVDDARE
ncbi:putative nucleoside phosphatase GDA1/CD39 [Plasmopara halstedii]